MWSLFCHRLFFISSLFWCLRMCFLVVAFPEYCSFYFYKTCGHCQSPLLWLLFIWKVFIGGALCYSSNSSCWFSVADFTNVKLDLLVSFTPFTEVICLDRNTFELAFWICRRCINHYSVVTYLHKDDKYEIFILYKTCQYIMSKILHCMCIKNTSPQFHLLVYKLSTKSFE